MAEVIQEASLVREYKGAYANMLTYKEERYSACGYLAPKNSLAFWMLPSEASYDTEGFLCPGCTKYQAVRIRLEPGGWATGYREY